MKIFTQMALKNVTTLAKGELVRANLFPVWLAAGKRCRGCHPSWSGPPHLSKLPAALEVAQGRIQRRRVGVVDGKEVCEGRRNNCLSHFPPLCTMTISGSSSRNRASATSADISACFRKTGKTVCNGARFRPAVSTSALRGGQERLFFGQQTVRRDHFRVLLRRFRMAAGREHGCIVGGFGMGRSQPAVADNVRIDDDHRRPCSTQPLTSLAVTVRVKWLRARRASSSIASASRCLTPLMALLEGRNYFTVQTAAVCFLRGFLVPDEGRAEWPSKKALRVDPTHARRRESMRARCREGAGRV